MFKTPIRMRNTALGALLLLGVIGAIGACGRSPASVAAPGMTFPVMSLASLAGGAVPPEALPGRALVINFWATWCEPCRKEMPSLERLHLQADPARLAVLGVSVDTDLHLAREFLLQHQLTFANYTDGDRKLARGALNVQAVPVTFLVAPDGTIKARITGVRDWGSADTLRMLEQTLAMPVTARQ